MYFQYLLKFVPRIEKIEYCIKRHTTLMENYFSCKVQEALTYLPGGNMWLMITFTVLNFESFLLQIVLLYGFSTDFSLKIAVKVKVFSKYVQRPFSKYFTKYVRWKIHKVSFKIWHSVVKVFLRDKFKVVIFSSTRLNSYFPNLEWVSGVYLSG